MTHSTSREWGMTHFSWRNWENKTKEQSWKESSYYTRKQFNWTAERGEHAQIIQNQRTNTAKRVCNLSGPYTFHQHPIKTKYHKKKNNFSNYNGKKKQRGVSLFFSSKHAYLSIRGHSYQFLCIFFSRIKRKPTFQWK